MVLDRTRPLCKLQNFKTGEAKSIALGINDIANLSTAAIVGEHHLYFLYPKLSGYDRTKTLLERRFKDDPFVWRRHALHDGLTQSPRTVDDNCVAKTAFGV